jgi:hypothetical protein
MALKRYDLMVPENFSFGIEVGLAIAAQIDEAVAKGVRHFSAKTKKEITNVKDILKCIDEDRVVAFWAPEFGKKQICMFILKEDGTGETIPLNGVHKEILDILYPGENNEEGYYDWAPEHNSSV